MQRATRTSGPGRLKVELLLALLLATGCAQPAKITANGCEVVKFETISGATANTSGIHHPPGRFRDFAELAIDEDHELIRQRNWGEATAEQQYCALKVMMAKAPSDVATRLDDAARGRQAICGPEYAGLVQAVRDAWRGEDVKSVAAANCGGI
jgi:hypothetical protein